MLNKFVFLGLPIIGLPFCKDTFPGGINALHCEVLHPIYNCVKLQARRFYKMLTSNRRISNPVYSHPVASVSLLLVSRQPRRFAKVFSSSNANSINRKRFSAVDTWASVHNARCIARRMHASPGGECASYCATRDPEVSSFFFRHPLRPMPRDRKGKLLRSLSQLPWNRNCPRPDN